MTGNRRQLGRVPNLELQKFFKSLLVLMHVRTHMRSSRVKSTCETKLGLSGLEENEVKWTRFVLFPEGWIR